MKLMQSEVINKKATICLSNVVRIDERSTQLRKQAIVSSIPTKKMLKYIIIVFRQEQIQKKIVSLILKSLEHGIWNVLEDHILFILINFLFNLNWLCNAVF